jgi:hypothetical protein
VGVGASGGLSGCGGEDWRGLHVGLVGVYRHREVVAGGGSPDVFVWWRSGSVCLNGVFCGVWKGGDDDGSFRAKGQTHGTGGMGW